MSLKLGNTDINKLYLGSTEIKKAYLGSTLVFDKTVVASGIYDNASVVYSLRRPDMATKWTNAVLKIRRSSDDATAFVFFDGNLVDDTITLSSLISTTSNTTPDATTLTTWVGANDAFVEQWIGITPNNTIDGNKTASQTTTAKQPQFISGGVILTDGTDIAIKYVRANSNDLIAGANLDLNDGLDFTMIAVGSSSNSNILGGLISTNATPGDKMTLVIDTRTQKIINVVDTSGLSVTNYLAQQTTSNQRLLTSTVNGTARTISAYYNGIIQDANVAWSGTTYPNTAFEIGGYANSNFLDGFVQEIVIFPSDKTADLTTLHADINSYYTIY